MNYNKKDMDFLAKIWDRNSNQILVCPQCKSKMIIVQLKPVHDDEDAYVPYDTVIECTSCDFKIKAESFSILGSVKDFDLKLIQIASRSPSGSRVISSYEHILDYDLLKKLKDSGELKEFLIVNKQVIQVIG